MQQAMKELQEKFKQKGLGDQNKKVEKKQQFVGNKDNFTSARKLLEAKLGGAKNTQAPVEPIKKQEIVGNKEGFSNAKKQLEARLGGGKQQQTENQGIKPPPPPPSLPSGTLPPPPPPPPSGLGLPLPPPPPPSLPNMLPPPPPPPPLNINTAKLTPPPSLPKIQVAQKQTKPVPPMPSIPKVQPSIPPPKQIKSPQITEPKKQVIKQIKPISVVNPKPQSQLKIPAPQQSTPKKRIFDNVHKEQQHKSFQKPKETVQQNISHQKKQHPRHTIFQVKTNGSNSLSRQLFGVDVAGYFKSILMSHSNIPKNVERSQSKKQYDFEFPSMLNQKRPNNKKMALYFDTDSDITSCYLPYYASDFNKQIKKRDKESLDAFKKKHKIESKPHIIIGIDWNADDNKIKQLKHLKQTLSFIQPEPYPELDYSKIRKTRHKIHNIMKKFEREQEYMKCEEQKKLRDKVDHLYQSFWTESFQKKNQIKREIDDIIDQIGKI